METYLPLCDMLDVFRDRVVAISIAERGDSTERAGPRSNVLLNPSVLRASSDGSRHQSGVTAILAR